MKNISEFKNFLHTNLLGYMSKVMVSKKDGEEFFKTFKVDLNKHVWDLLMENGETFFTPMNEAIDELTGFAYVFSSNEEHCINFVKNIKIFMGSNAFEYSN